MIIEPNPGRTIRRSTSAVRKNISALIDWVNRPEATVILTRHGRPVAALVSLYDLQRIMSEEEMEEIIGKLKEGDRHKLPGDFFHLRIDQDSRDSAEEVRRIQLRRAKERSILENWGLEPVPGGEVEIAVEEETPKKRWWWW